MIIIGQSVRVDFLSVAFIVLSRTPSGRLAGQDRKRSTMKADDAKVNVTKYS